MFPPPMSTRRKLAIATWDSPRKGNIYGKLTVDATEALDEGFAPPTPSARVPVYLLAGAVSQRPAVKDGELVQQPQLTVTATVDHRFIDGHEAATLGNVMRDVLENSWQLEDGGAPTV